MAQGSDRHPEFPALALGHLAALYNAAHRLTGNEHDAEDLVQETYVQAFRHAGQLRNVAHCKAWLFQILRSRFVSAKRRERTRSRLTVVAGGTDPAEDLERQYPSLDRNVLALLTRPAIVEALAKLPEELRTALLLCDADGFTYEEIAETMQCPIGTVRSRIARARAQLIPRLAAQAESLGIRRKLRS